MNANESPDKVGGRLEIPVQHRTPRKAFVLKKLLEVFCPEPAQFYYLRCAAVRGSSHSAIISATSLHMSRKKLSLRE
jgi:hypothetical protein